MEILLITGLFIAFALAGVASSVAAHFYGQNKLLPKMLIEAKRREMRLSADLALWQGKVLEKAGMGNLRRRIYPEIPQPSTLINGKRFVSPGEVISDLKREVASGVKKVPKEVVPATVRHEFLREAGNLAVLTEEPKGI